MRQIHSELKELLEDIVNYKLCPFTMPFSHMRTVHAVGHPMLVFACGVTDGSYTARGGEQGGEAIGHRALTPCSMKYASDCKLYLVGISKVEGDTFGGV